MRNYFNPSTGFLELVPKRKNKLSQHLEHLKIRKYIRHEQLGESHLSISIGIITEGARRMNHFNTQCRMINSELGEELS